MPKRATTEDIMDPAQPTGTRTRRRRRRRTANGQLTGSRRAGAATGMHPQSAQNGQVDFTNARERSIWDRAYALGQKHTCEVHNLPIR